MSELHYGIIEKYKKEIHGPLKKTKYDTFLKTKFISFENKEPNETSKEFFNHWKQYYPNSEITLKKVYTFNHYSFAIDRKDIIVKIQRLWRNYIQRKYNLFYTRDREIDFFFKKNIHK